LAALVGFAASKISWLKQGDVLKPIVSLVNELILLIVLVICTWIMAKIEKRKVISYGFVSQNKFLPALIGSLWGFVSLSTLVLLMWKFGYITFNGFAIHGADIFTDALIYGLMFFIVGLFEEFLFRGYLQYTLTRGMGFWAGTLVVAVFFTLAHISNGGETGLGLFSVALASLVFSVSLWYTRSLWWAIGFHAGWDWAQSYFYGTPDSGLLAQGHLLNSKVVGSKLWSGGTTGPEGSLFLIPVLILVIIGMYIAWHRNTKVGILATNAAISKYSAVADQ